MKDYQRFSETQKFRQWWLWFTFAGIKGIMGFFIVTQVLFGEPFGDNVVDNVALLIGFLFMLILSLLFFIIKLETRISDEGIAVRFYPIQLKFRNLIQLVLLQHFRKKFHDFCCQFLAGTCIKFR